MLNQISGAKLASQLQKPWLIVGTRSVRWSTGVSFNVTDLVDDLVIPTMDPRVELLWRPPLHLSAEVEVDSSIGVGLRLQPNGGSSTPTRRSPVVEAVDGLGTRWCFAVINELLIFCQ